MASPFQAFSVGRNELHYVVRRVPLVDYLVSLAPSKNGPDLSPSPCLPQLASVQCTFTLWQVFGNTSDKKLGRKTAVHHFINWWGFNRCYCRNIHQGKKCTVYIMLYHTVIIDHQSNSSLLGLSAITYIFLKQMSDI